ncbi:MAG: acyl-CoA dehydrogenase family protein [Pseudomonadota bacterium]
MNLEFSADELAFRDEVREKLAANYPDDIRNKQDNGVELGRDDYVRWQKALYKLGWIAPNYPVEYGGTGWTPVQKYIFETELARINAPRVIPFGISMVGPVIYTFGSEVQKERFLPDILQSNVWWCQGYSEPGAGSDLASLKTRADRDGDHYVINGTKTWTTLGQHADWIFVLARTNSDVERRQEGISFLLADMKTPGITVRPIITMEGGHEVNEVHFEDVRVPVENLVGEEGRGWTYGKVLLQHERTNIAGVANSQYRLRRLKKLASGPIRGGEPLLADASFRRKIARTEIELKALEFTDLRTLATVAAGKAPGPESSILKIKGTELQQAIDHLYLEAAGYYALPFVPDQFTLDVPADERVGEGNEARSALKYFNFRKASIYGGSNEIQKNIIAKHVLGL